MAEDHRSSLTTLLVPTTFLALLLQILAGTAYRSEATVEQPHTEAAPRTSPDYLNAEKLLSGHLGRQWQGHRDPGLAALDFLIATVPDPVVSRLDSTFDRYFDAIQRAVEADGYHLDRFDLPWARAKAALDAQMAYTDGHIPDPKGPRFAQHPGVLLFKGRNDTGPKALILYLVGETPTAGVNQTALTTALTEIAELCWSSRLGTAFVSRASDRETTCESRTIKMLGPSFSGSRRSLEIALTEWPGTAEYLNPVKPFELLSGTVTNVSDLHGLPPGTLKTTVLPDETFLRGIFHYLTGELGASCSEIAFLTEGSTFGLGLRLEIDKLRWEQNDCELLSLTFPLHLAELRREAERARSTAQPTGGLSTADEHIPIGDNARIDRSVVGLMSTADAASSELVLRNVLSTLAREQIRYVGLISTDVRDRLFLARQVSRHSPNTVLFLYGADVLYLHSDYNVALRGALVVTPYPLVRLNQLWTLPFEGDQYPIAFPVSTAQGVYNAGVALLGRDDLLREYGQPFAKYTHPRRPALWLTAVGKDQFFPISILPIDQARKPVGNGELPTTVPAGDDPAYGVYAGINPSKVWQVATDNQWLHGLGMFAERGLVPDVTATVMFIITLLSAGLATIVLLTCAHHVRSPTPPRARDVPKKRLSNIQRMKRALDSGMDLAGQWLWLTKDGRLDAHRWRCVLVLVSTAAALYLLSAAMFLLPMPAVAAFTGETASGQWPVPGPARLAVAAVLALMFVAVVRVALQPLTPAASEAAPAVSGRAPRALGAVCRRRMPGGAAVVALAGGLGLSAWLVVHWYRLPPTEQLLLSLRAADLRGGLSPMLPLLLVAATVIWWAACEWRRLHLTDDLTVTRQQNGRHARSIAFLPFYRGSLASVAALECRIQRLMTGRITELPPSLVLGGGLVYGIAMMRVWTKAPWSVEGTAFDWLWWTAFALGYALLLATFVRGFYILSCLQRLLRHLAYHPLRTSFGELQRVHGRTLRVDPARSCGSTNVLALTIEHATRFAAALPASVSARNRTALACRLEDGERALEASLDNEATQNWLEASNQRRLAHAHVSKASARIASLLDAYLWHANRAPAAGAAPGLVRVAATASVDVPDEGLGAAARTKQNPPGVPSTGPAAEPTVANPFLGTLTDANRSPGDLGVDQKAFEAWTKEGRLMLASRVADFLNHVLALLRHLSLFVTFGLILMLLASASYPFQPRDLVLALNWSVIVTVVVVSMVAIVRLGRDPILTDLAGTEQSLFKRDTLTKVFIYVALPILSLLGVQFPEMFNRLLPWLNSVASGH